MHVLFVVKGSVTVELVLHTCKYTVMKNHMVAPYVVKDSNKLEDLSYMKEHIGSKDHYYMNVMFVVKDSTKKYVFPDI